MHAADSQLHPQESMIQGSSQDDAGLVKRLGIFVFFDPQGVVDDYVEYLLSDLCTNISRLYIVVNGYVDRVGIQRLRAFSEDVIIRENLGYDLAAWKYVICDVLTLGELDQYDELVLLNDTFYGPFVPFRRIFQEMENRPVDFWGLTRHVKDRYAQYVMKYDHVPEFIQSYFVVVGRRMLGTAAFRRYWEEIGENLGFDDVVHNHEHLFAKHFAELGFRWDTYISDIYDVFEGNDHAICLNTLVPAHMISKKGLPIVRRKALAMKLSESLVSTDGLEARKALDYIRTETTYPTEMIWQNLLRRYPMMVLKDALHLNFILDADGPDRDVSLNVTPSQRVVVVAVLYYEELLDEALSYLQNVPSFVRVVVATSNQSLMRVLPDRLAALGLNWEIRFKDNRGRDLSGLLVACNDVARESDLLCFVHDKKSHAEDVSFTVGRDFRHTLFDNLLASEDYVCRIVGLFESDPSLGLLVPPMPMHGAYYGVAGMEWTDNLVATQSLLKALGAKIEISLEDTPFGVGSAFWCRTVALKKLLDFDWKYSDFPTEPMPYDATVSHAIERSFIFLAQDQGFYSGMVMTREYASMIVSRGDGMIRVANHALRGKHEYITSDVGDFIRKLESLVWKEGELTRVFDSKTWRVATLLGGIYRRLRAYVREPLRVVRALRSNLR